MTEAEWLACEDPPPMLAFLRDSGKASERKLRLFACACVRRLWHLLPGERCRGAVEAAERYADGAARAAQLAAAHAEARGEFFQLRPSKSGALAALAVLSASTAGPERLADAVSQAGFAPASEVAVVLALARQGGERWPRSPVEDPLPAERRGQVALLRCVFGNPFRPVALDPAWLAWNGGTVSRLARAIYDERAFGRLPVLADALGDAGCADPEILSHCRSGGEHVCGCGAVDLLLGKECRP